MAHTFARLFLVPTTGLLQFLARDVGSRRLLLADMVAAKHQFRVSLKVITLRLFHEGRIAEADKKELWSRADQLGQEEFAPLDKKKILSDWEEKRRFETLARKAILGELISIGKLAELLGENLIQTRSRVQVWRKELNLQKLRRK